VGRFFDWPLLDSIFLGAMLSMSSTTVIIKVLGELGKMRERFSQLIFGILIIEDILGIAMIALLSGIAMTGHLSVGDVGMTLGKLGVFLAVTLVAGLIFVPRLISYVARFKSNEMLIVTVLGLCFGVSLLAVKLGYSVALGAFVIGAVIAETREIHKIEGMLEPVRDMFSAIFFVAIGLLIQPEMLITYWKPIVVITLAVIIGKVITCSLGSYLGGNDTRTSLRVGMGLAQIGEFSFIIASLGVTLKVTSEFLYPIAVAVSAITTLFTPYLIRSADGMVNWFDRSAPKSVVNTLEIYTRWVGQLGGQRHTTMASKLLWRWMLQMSLNVVLVAAVFIIAAYIERRPPAWAKSIGVNNDVPKAALWLGAVILSLPMLIATFRKLQALGLLIAETKVTRVNAGDRTSAVRALVAQVVPIAGAGVLVLFVLALSATLLPSREVFIVMLGFVAIITWLLWRSSVRIYSRAQLALRETFAQLPDPHPHQKNANGLTSMLKDADLATVTIRSDCIAAGKLISQLGLRSKTGASIVGIERKGSNVINPNAHEEIQAGDNVLLLGTQTQLQAAKAVLESSLEGQSKA
jgi:CPA2 family monovalent cation:H+ antiporter-2